MLKLRHVPLGKASAAACFCLSFSCKARMVTFLCLCGATLRCQKVSQLPNLGCTALEAQLRTGLPLDVCLAP